jgi:hypothetical protein
MLCHGRKQLLKLECRVAAVEVIGMEVEPNDRIEQAPHVNLGSRPASLYAMLLAPIASCACASKRLGFTSRRVKREAVIDKLTNTNTNTAAPRAHIHIRDAAQET